MKLFVVALLSLGLSGVVVAADKEPTACMDLYLKRCDECHYMDRVCKQLGERSASGWEKTINRMVKKRGAEVSEDEQKILVECLAAPAPDMKKECKK